MNPAMMMLSVANPGLLPLAAIDTTPAAAPSSRRRRLAEAAEPPKKKRRPQSISGVRYDDVMIPVYIQTIRKTAPYTYEPYGPLKATRTKEPFELNLGMDPEEDLYHNARRVVPEDCEVYLGASRDNVRGKVVRVYFYFSPEDSAEMRKRWKAEDAAKRQLAEEQAKLESDKAAEAELKAVRERLLRWRLIQVGGAALVVVGLMLTFWPK